jgi:hypothetical protein
MRNKDAAMAEVETHDWLYDVLQKALDNKDARAGWVDQEIQVENDRYVMEGQAKKTKFTLLEYKERDKKWSKHWLWTQRRRD